ncbi:hypothetical protein OHW01_15655 [Acinetobacter baumannii]|uniref:hypothetical protein n=1 Tax=Acinetobacter baumannii TaxID=470 RepID=UPI0023425B0C|nr:hypothetical protein [Acinetobacter baumannii]MDC4674851.1 hypothetical protein [Acinetobacter baumannii]MDC4886143.1 hypothetical protein [Acinetobacter baumannii]MDC4910046.1 hypothetical protein [Acinetobacter baumannii]MDC4926790.1 hypothetical protein [Acinetobacter baumannii]MDC4929455.1 hypothetical protein [Acinetobacter baumannii]
MITAIERLQVAQLMKEHRQLLINQIVNLELTELLEKSFRHEKSIQICRIALEQSICLWINQQIESAFQISNEVGSLCVLKLSTLLQKNLNFYISENSVESELVSKLLIHKISMMESLIEFENINEYRLNQLKFEMSKDEALFNRLFHNLQDN